MFWGKAKKIEELVLTHLRQVDVALNAFEESVIAYVVDHDVSRAKTLALETHKAEGAADDIRREVEGKLLGGALLASRRDILDVIEQIDRLANSGEAVLDTLLLERIEFPEDIEDYVRRIVVETAKITDLVNSAVEAIFRDPASALQFTKQIEEIEGKIDQIERETLKAIFTKEIDLARKLQLRDFIGQLVEISDRAEDLSDRIDVMVAERRF